MQDCIASSSVECDSYPGVPGSKKIFRNALLVRIVMRSVATAIAVCSGSRHGITYMNKSGLPLLVQSKALPAGF